MAEEMQGTTKNAKSLPIAKNEDVEFCSEKADADDLEAVDRAHAADQRQQTKL
jgi:hypothetical protein